MFEFLLLQTNFFLVQTDGVSKLILSFIPVPPPPGTDGLRNIRDHWDADEWGHYHPGYCIRRG